MWCYLMYYRLIDDLYENCLIKCFLMDINKWLIINSRKFKMINCKVKLK